MFWAAVSAGFLTCWDPSASSSPRRCRGLERCPETGLSRHKSQSPPPTATPPAAAPPSSTGHESPNRSSGRRFGRRMEERFEPTGRVLLSLPDLAIVMSACRIPRRSRSAGCISRICDWGPRFSARSGRVQPPLILDLERLWNRHGLRPDCVCISGGRPIAGPRRVC